jgi:hypothetical protein
MTDVPPGLGPNPPQPPNLQQGGNALGQFASNAQGNGGIAGAAPDESLQFAMASLSEVESALSKVAQILVVLKPEVIPLLKVMAQAGQQLKQALGQQTQGGAEQGASAPMGSPGEGAAGAASSMQMA